MLNRRPIAAILLIGFLAAVLGGALSGGQPAFASRYPASAGQSSSSGTSASGLTVSWLPTNQPVQTKPGQTTTATFWVSNTTAKPIPVTISPVTAVPGNNGTLTVRNSQDGRFPGITYSPSEFVAQPNSTTAVTMTTTVPSTLRPGAYILPAVVQPGPSTATGNIQVKQSIVALITLQLPGPVDAHLKPAFIRSGMAVGNTVVRQFPGLPPIQIAMKGHATLRVRNDSTSSFYSYNEIRASHTPVGPPEIDGHIPGDTTDYRTEPALYFPGLYRDYPVSWTPGPLGIGVSQLAAYVAYHPNSATISQLLVSATVVVVSPWWLLAIIVYFGVVLAVADQRTRRHSRAKTGRRRARSRTWSLIWQIAGSIALAVVAAIAVLFADLAVFTITAGAGVVLAALLTVDARRRRPASAARRILAYHSVIGVLLIAGIAGVLLSTLSTWSPGIAIGAVAGTGVWTLFAWWLHTWNSSRPAPAPITA